MKKFITLTFLCLLASISTTGCVSTENAESVQGLLATVSTHDGIDKIEAENIAKAYFRHNIGCGYFKEVTDTEDNWVVQGGFGYAGTPIEGFLINKNTGAIASPVGPSYRSPFEIPSEPN
jgi:hypothetical protein